MKWNPIDTSPSEGQFLVTGGSFKTVMDFDVGEKYEVALVHAGDKPPYRDEDDPLEYHLVHICYYQMWIENPTHWMPLPELPKD